MNILTMRKVYEMKKLIVMVTGAVMLFSSVAMANAHHKNKTVRVQAEVISSNVITQQVVQRVPEKQCNLVDVPIYSQGNASTGDVLAGAIIGGVIGNQFGKGKGNDAATVLGAIIGADTANKNNGNKTIVGYKQVQQCNTIFIETVADKIVGYSTSMKTSEGETYTFQTSSQYAIGTIVFLNKTVSLN